MSDFETLRLSAADGDCNSFLSNIGRVSAAGYVPTTGLTRLILPTEHVLTSCAFTDDILHARIQTMGVAEHVFDMSVHGRTVRWHLYDVGGARGQRHSWISYFDDACVCFFLLLSV